MVRRMDQGRIRGAWALGIILGAGFFASGWAAEPESLRVASPDGGVKVNFALRDWGEEPACPSYSVNFGDRVVLRPSRIGLDGAEASFLAGMKIDGHTRHASDSTWRPVSGERSEIRDHFNQLAIDLSRSGDPQRKLRITIRAYNEGVAFRMTIPPQVGMAEAEVNREHTEFRFTDNHTAWATSSAQGDYHRVNLNEIPSGCERPLVVRIAEDLYAAIAEARLVDYARMKLAPLEGVSHTLISQLAGPVSGPLPFRTPWRVVLLGSSPGRLWENHFLILNLNDPCAIGDTSWIKPGKVIREVTLTTAGGKACVDFAVDHGLQYVEFDAGWYGHEYDPAADATAVNVDPNRSPGPLDLHEVIRYAEPRGIGIILYVNRRALEKQLDQILPLYQSWGIKGVKYGFVNVGSQSWTRWLHEAVAKAARHRLMVDIHDEYRPTGFSRTYPNLMTMEGIRGDEARPSAEQTLITLFTRMLAGPADNTVCYADPRVDELWSHAYQLAKPVCFFSPWQFLFWYDRPEEITGTPELEFFKHLPTTWDESRALAAAIGEYAVIARRRGTDWFVGIMNAGPEREFNVPMNFLAPEKSYHLRTYVDDPRSNSPTHVRINQSRVEQGEHIAINIRRHGGAALHLYP